MIEFLICKGNAVSAVDNDNKTPLLWALEEQSIKSNVDNKFCHFVQLFD